MPSESDAHQFFSQQRPELESHAPTFELLARAGEMLDTEQQRWERDADEATAADGGVVTSEQGEPCVPISQAATAVDPVEHDVPSAEEPKSEKPEDDEAAAHEAISGAGLAPLDGFLAATAEQFAAMVKTGLGTYEKAVKIAKLKPE